ncbi:MAG: hypothetical protein KDC92_12955 [Bacteroidetes bacterium]|nr:hypothetical protein [Bacteroidota bacterium]
MSISLTFKLFVLASISVVHYQTDQETALNWLQNHKWYIGEIKQEKSTTLITGSLKEMYWFKFHEDGTYSAMFQGDLSAGTYSYLHKSSQLEMHFEPYGTDILDIYFEDANHMQLKGKIYGNDGSMKLYTE